MNELTFEINLVISITEKALGLTPGTLNTKTKTEDLVLGRMVACNILMDGGLTPAKLGEHFRQHRTNFYHYRKQHKNYVDIPGMYPQYLELFNRVLDEYEERSVSVRLKDDLTKLEVIEDIDITLDRLLEQKKLLQKSLKTL